MDHPRSTLHQQDFERNVVDMVLAIKELATAKAFNINERQRNALRQKFAVFDTNRREILFKERKKTR